MINKKQIFIYLIILLVFVITSGCSENILQVISHKTGSSISRDGLITNTNLDFKFKKFKKPGKNKDLFNYLYFEGDTLCFSVIFNKNIKKHPIKALFINPDTGESYPVERIEKYKNRVSGFSLVGSLMESYYKKKLNDNLPDNKYCCKNINFIIKISVYEKNTPKLEYKITDKFKISYN